MDKRNRTTRTIYLLIMGLISVDLWILLKVRRFAKFMIKILGSLMQILFIIALSAGVLVAYSLAKVEIDVPVYADEYRYLGSKPTKNQPLSIDSETAAAAESSLMKKELENLKNQALSLELSLRKMENQYKDFSKIALSNRRDEELADFASEAAGGSVLDTPDTESYYEPSHQQTTLFGIPIWKANYFTPRKVIQPWTQAGECWAFRGSRGKIVIELAYPTLIDGVTIEHIPVSASLTGSINSAPKNLVLYGLIDRTFVALGSFTYDINGPSSHRFKLKENKEDPYPVKTILLEIQSNWGHPDYTCIYRFKVHGKLADPENYRGGMYIGED